MKALIRKIYLDFGQIFCYMYYMTQEQQDAIIGRVLRERGEAERHLAALQAEAARLGAYFIKVGSMLDKHPETVFFEALSTNIKYAGSNPQILQGSNLSLEATVHTTNEIRDAMEKVERLRAECERLRIPCL